MLKYAYIQKVQSNLSNKYIHNLTPPFFQSTQNNGLSQPLPPLDNGLTCCACIGSISQVNLLGVSGRNGELAYTF